MKLILPKWVNAKHQLKTTTPEFLMLLMKSKKLLKLSNLLEAERDNSSKTLILVKRCLLCFMSKKLLLELREPKTVKISLLDKNKPNSSSMLLKLSFPSLKPLPHTLLLKLSLNFLRLVPLTQSKLLLKLLPLLMVLLLTNASDFLNNSKLISPLSLMMTLKLKSKPKLTSIILWSKLLPWEKILKKNSLLTETNSLKSKLLLLTNKEDFLRTNKNLRTPLLDLLLRLLNVLFTMLTTKEILNKETLSLISLRKLLKLSHPNCQALTTS